MMVRVGSGFVGGAVGNMAGEASRGVGLLENAGIAGLAGGVTSMASGGDFANGFQSVAYNVLYNHAAGGVVDSVKKGVGFSVDGMSGFGQELGGLARAVGNVAAGIPDPVYDVANIGLGIAEVMAYGTGVGALPIGAANIVVNSGALYKTYKENGLYSRQFAINAAATAGGPFVSKGAGMLLNRASLIYNHLDR